ncbi:TetR family transcriptional regulator [bacterium]|nr:TetR family transcriptional regulator [bacterium]
MNKTKQNILNESRLLFNELGFSQVTIRMIALKLNMSSGNLNYHFKKREDILEALYVEMVAVFDARIEDLGNEPLTLKKMRDDVKTSMARMIDYRFFWTDLFNLLKLNPKIRTRFEKAYAERIKGTHFLFEVFIKENLLTTPSFESEHQLLMERMINFSNTWLYSSGLYTKRKLDQESIEHHTNLLMLMLYPYLTDLGKGKFRKVVPELYT